MQREIFGCGGKDSNLRASEHESDEIDLASPLRNIYGPADETRTRICLLEREELCSN